MALNKTHAMNKERLKAVAIKRYGVVHERGFRSHYQLRQALGDTNPQARNLGDEEGFVTSTGRFVDRDEAMTIGAAAGQCNITTRELLSSDIDW